MNYVLALIIPIIMAFSFRARGGAIPLGSTTAARLVFYVLPVTLVMAYIAWIHHFPWWVVPFSALSAFGGICIGHSPYQGNSIVQFTDMTGIILIRLAAIFWPFAGFHIEYLLPVSAGALTLPACWLGWHYTRTVRLFGIQWTTAGDSSCEEWLIGLLPLGVAMSTAVLI